MAEAIKEGCPIDNFDRINEFVVLYELVSYCGGIYEKESYINNSIFN